MITKKNFVAPTCAAAIFLMLWGCAVTMKIPEPESAAAKLFTEKCSLCHTLPHPRRLSVHEWERYFRLMKANMKKKGLSLSQEEEGSILGYLKRNAR